jgi:hypothetical protein
MFVILIDELVFHLKRDLPRWERIGHPLDTLTVVGCFAFVWYIPYSPQLIAWYVACAVFSCLFVTKDEFVHKHHCPAQEQWLHAVLFVNHSIVLFALGCIWPHLHGEAIFSFMPDIKRLKILIISQALGSVLFFLYQVIYWNWIRRETYEKDQ